MGNEPKCRLRKAAAETNTTAEQLSTSTEVPNTSHSRFVSGIRNVWLAISTPASISSRPVMPATPNPGSTKISTARNATPVRNRTISSTSAVPPRKRLQKNSAKHSSETKPPRPRPGVLTSTYNATKPDDEQQSGDPGPIQNVDGGVHAGWFDDLRRLRQPQQLLQLLPAVRVALRQRQFHGPPSVHFQETALARLQHRGALFPLIRVRRRLEFVFRHELLGAGLAVGDFVDHQIHVHHRFGQGRRTASPLGQIADLASQIAAHFFRRVAKQEIFAQDDRPGVAQHGVGIHDDLLAAQRDDGGAAQRLARHIRHGRRPIQVPQPMGDVETGLDQPTRTVDFHDHQVGAVLLGIVQLAVQELLQQRRDRALESDQHGRWYLG